MPTVGVHIFVDEICFGETSPTAKSENTDFFGIFVGYKSITAGSWYFSCKLRYNMDPWKV